MPMQPNNGRSSGGPWRPDSNEPSRDARTGPWARDRDEYQQRETHRDRGDDYRTRPLFDRDHDDRGRYLSEMHGDRAWEDRLGAQRGMRGQMGDGSGYGYEGGRRISSGREEGLPVGGHRGKGPRNFIRSDARIREMVCEVLSEDDRIDASRIEVEVRDGEVTLTGAVDDRHTKRLAEDVIERLPSVKDVHNHIRVHRFEENIDHLNSFLRGEISAVETYRMALEKLDRGSTARSELENCMRSHEERVQFLRDQIRRLGGTPASSSGSWGVFARAVEGGARVLGDKIAIAALEEGEDHGLKDYKHDIDKLDPVCRELVRSRLLPAQQETHARMSSLKRRL